MHKRLLVLVCVFACALLSGCATRGKMPQLSKTSVLEAGHDPIYLVSLTLRNEHISRYQPELIAAHLARPGSTKASDRVYFRPDDESEDETMDDDTGYRYFLRLQLPREDFVLTGFNALGSGFPFHGAFFAPVLASIPPRDSGIYYLGHIDAVVRARTGDEFRAGPVIPLLDQAATGASTGTFDVAISDRWTEDEARFHSHYPALKTMTVQKHLLPPFDRAKAQSWWEGD
jgi:hypothetical protein